MHVGVLEMSYMIGSTEGYSSSLTKKKKFMAINDDPFPLITLVNTTSFNLKALIKSKNERKLSPRKV